MSTDIIPYSFKNSYIFFVNCLIYFETVPYVINQYQFARRYKYNNHGFIDYFNSVIDRAKKNDGVYTSPTDYISVGEFDLLEIIKVNSFKKYHDVSEMAKDWVGKRQSVLLYDISDVDCPTNFYFDENGTRKWIDISGDVREKVDKRFFCLSMMSLTNEIIEGINDISMILKKIRRHILNLVYQVNEKCKTDIRCEVFGTFNTAEIGIIWLGDQYTDILRLIDFIKFLEFQDIIGNKCRAFFSSYSTMAFQKQTIKEDQNLCDLNGDAIIQMAIHDRIDNYKTIYEIYKQFCGDQNYELSYFVGEYDFGITMPASKVLHLITDRETKKFFVNVRVYETGMILYDDDDISKSIIRTNIKLLYSADAVVSLNNFFENNGNNLLNIQIDKPISAFKHLFENKELFTKEEYESYYPEKKDSEFNSVKSLYEGVRAKLKNNITSSAGAVDTLDLLYTDYKSVISSAYNAIWVSDFHRQFYSILFQINLLINSQNNKGLSNDSASTTMRWKWDQFQDLTNAFKQQIYHLSQSSRMFFETPNCHFRSTGQYDFLMHTYYGISKRIIETVYLMQKADPQSELVPLITVNTVPQVKSQLYFECGKSDEMRTINIDIPNSIIFDPYRGMCYLTHELFHYSVPESREKRNRVIGILFISRFFYDNVFYALKDIMITSLGKHSHRKEYETFVNVGKKCSTEQTEPSHRKEYEKLVNVFFQCCHRYFDEVSDSDKSIEKEFGVEKKIL